MSKYFDKGKILIGESWAVMPSSLYKGVIAYGICVHNDVYYHINCAYHNRKKITPAPLKVGIIF